MNTVKENQSYFSKLGIRFFLGSVIIYFAQIFVTRGVCYFAPDFYMKYQFIISMLPMYVIAIPIMIFLIKQLPAQEVKEKKKMKGLTFLCFFLIAYAGMYLSNILGNILAALIGAIKGSGVTNSILTIATTNNLFANFVIMVICAPIIEEFVFRKLLIDRTRQYGDKTAILLSGLMFGFFHGNIYQFCYAFVMGLIFAYVYVTYNDVKYAIFLHMIINFFGSILGILIMKQSGFAEIAAVANDPNAVMEVMMEHLSGLLIFLVYFIFIIGMVIAGIVLFLVNRKKITLNQGTLEIAKGEAFKTIVLNPGMGLFFLFWTLAIIYYTIIPS